MTDTVSTPEFLTVKELAALLRIKERKVYDLASSGVVPVSRVTGKLLFPEKDVRAWIASGRAGGEAAGAAARPPIFLGSHDPLLEWAVRQSGCGLATRFDGSFDGLARFQAGEGVACGLHVQDAGSGEWNVPQVAEVFAGTNAVLVAFARRKRGLVVRREDEGVISGVADLGGRRVMPRSAETGTQALLLRMLGEAGLAVDEVLSGDTAPSENDAVLGVLQGAADAAFGLEVFARRYGLGFVPVLEERFDLLVCRRAWFEPPLQTLMRFLRGESFLGQAAEMAGYDASEVGQVRWNA